MKKGFAILILILSLVITSACGTALNGNDSEDSALTAVKDFDELVSLLRDMNGSQNLYYAGREVLETAAASKSAETDSSQQSGASDHSGTNVQVEGVDESDIIKTDGRYIYYVNNDRIVIIEAYPAETMKVLKSIEFAESDFYPTEIYLNGKYLVVIGSKYYYYPMPMPDTRETAPEGSASEGKAPDEIEAGDAEGTDTAYETDSPAYKMPYYRGKDTVNVLLYDVEDPSDAKLVRSFETDGYLVSSRMIGTELYIISNKYVYVYSEDPEEGDILPMYRDSAATDDFVAVGYDSIKYFPDGQDSSYLLIAGLDLEDMGAEVSVQAFLGSGQTVYASEDNLYITISKWEYEYREVEEKTDTDGPIKENSDETEPDMAITMIMPYDSNVTTKIYKFALDKGKAVFTAQGEVPGSLLNQFSMDEHNGYFRIATTTGDTWRDDEFTSRNNLYILDSSLAIKGRIEGIAPGERIYSVRFIGDRGYMVTFKTVDPLFVLDLKDPAKPSILGELKIPGYSGYLHPYGDDHIIGFGMDTVETKMVDGNGKVYGEAVYQLGMKMAMFDVSDVSRPIEKYSIRIGDSGTYSEILYNHKSLVFSEEKNILAFPITVVMSGSGKPHEYGEITFQGMHVYGMGPETGFTLKAAITHLSEQELKDAQKMWFDYMKAVERGLYINDVFYTVSKAYIKASSMDTFAEIGMLPLK